MKKKILSYLLAASMLFTQISVFAEGEATEDTTTEATEVVEVTIKPENYAAIYLNQTGYSEHNTTRALNLYYNTPYTANSYIYNEHGSIISSYKVPLKTALDTMSVNYYVAKGTGIRSDRYIPIIYDTNSFSINAEAGVYALESAEYIAVQTYADNYWCSTGTTSHKLTGKAFASQIAAKVTSTATGTQTFDITTTALPALIADTEEEYLTLAVAREISGYTNSAFGMNTEEKVPVLNLKYSKTELVAYINSAAQADMAEIISGLGAIGVLDSTNYSSLIKMDKEYVDGELYKTAANGGFADLEAFCAAYGTHVAYAAENGTIIAINGVKSEAEMKVLLQELGEAGALDLNTEYSYSEYTALNETMQKYVVNELYGVTLADGFADLTAFYKAYDKAVKNISEIPASIFPENYATIHITKDGYADHKKYAKTLRAYYNSMYYGITYGEFGSVISGFEVPLKDLLKNISIQYYVRSGGMKSERTIPVFYDFNMFSINAENGKYDGPVAATDTTQALEAAQEYKDILEYTENYWPANGGYSYSKTNWASQVAHNILETSSGTKTYDVTDKLLDKFKSSESDSITFATGRDTSEYSYGAIDTSTNEKMPKLVLAYNAMSVLEAINTASASEIVKLIDDFGKAGILAGSTQGYSAYEKLSATNKNNVAQAIYETASNEGYSTFKEFIDDYDKAVVAKENLISRITISDGDKTYRTAKDAADKEVTVTAPVSFAQSSGEFTAILAEYADGVLVSAQTKSVSYDETELYFTHTLSKDATEIKIMVFDSLKGLVPICKSKSDSDNTLDGKKVIFIGDSYVYYGRTVEAASGLTQEERSDDRGGFYQLCKANGMDVSVTNWTFGSHGLRETFDGICTETTCSGYGECHEDYLTDREFDYVIISPTRGADMAVDFEYIMDFFREANPNVKFVCLGSSGIHGISKNDVVYSDIIEYYDVLKEKGVIVADWGEMVKDIITGDVMVPGATQEYTRSSFVVSDNYHPNLLTGYLTTLFAYCAIMEESATEQTYSYISDGSVSDVFNVQAYLKAYYTNGNNDTNFPEILASQSDMRSLQQLVDDYLETKPYRENPLPEA